MNARATALAAYRRRNTLHVRTYIEDTIQMCEFLLDARPSESQIPPEYVAYLRQIATAGRAILQQHAATASPRADVRLPRGPRKKLTKEQRS